MTISIYTLTLLSSLFSRSDFYLLLLVFVISENDLSLSYKIRILLAISVLLDSLEEIIILD